MPVSLASAGKAFIVGSNATASEANLPDAWSRLRSVLTSCFWFSSLNSVLTRFATWLKLSIMSWPDTLTLSMNDGLTSMRARLSPSATSGSGLLPSSSRIT